MWNGCSIDDQKVPANCLGPGRIAILHGLDDTGQGALGLGVCTLHKILLFPDNLSNDKVKGAGLQYAV